MFAFDTATGKTSEVKIDITSDDKENEFALLTIRNEADSYDLSPSTRRARAMASALLPDGKLLVTERLPGAFRIVGKDGVGAPLTGLEGLHVSTPMTGLLDVVLDPAFATNHTIYFTYFEYLDKTVYNTAVARAMQQAAWRPGLVRAPVWRRPQRPVVLPGAGMHWVFGPLLRGQTGHESRPVWVERRCCCCRVRRVPRCARPNPPPGTCGRRCGPSGYHASWPACGRACCPA